VGKNSAWGQITWAWAVQLGWWPSQEYKSVHIRLQVWTTDHSCIKYQMILSFFATFSHSSYIISFHSWKTSSSSFEVSQILCLSGLIHLDYSFNVLVMYASEFLLHTTSDTRSYDWTLYHVMQKQWTFWNLNSRHSFKHPTLSFTLAFFLYPFIPQSYLLASHLRRFNSIVYLWYSLQTPSTSLLQLSFCTYWQIPILDKPKSAWPTVALL
jgi:hypothetical protein